MQPKLYLLMKKKSGNCLNWGKICGFETLKNSSPSGTHNPHYLVRNAAQSVFFNQEEERGLFSI
jgi:hypothetical protein